MGQRVFLAHKIDSLSVSKALDLNNRDDWIQAMDAEIESIKSHDTYEEVDCLFNKKVISTKGILRVKRDSNNNVARYKARFVAKGFSQQPGLEYDLIFSPTLSKEALRVLFCIAANQTWSVQHLDVQTASISERKIFI
jgi:Reverse transcriptase (RNA-dependent DNA polymerase)